MARKVYVDVLNKSSIDDDDDITLVLQLTSSRSEKLYSLVLRWPVRGSPYISSIFFSARQHNVIVMSTEQ